MVADTLVDLVREYPTTSLIVATGVGAGLYGLFQRIVNKPEFRNFRLGDNKGNTFSFKGKKIAGSYYDEGGGQCSFHYWAGLDIYQTEQGNFVLQSPYTEHCLGTLEGEEQLFQYIQRMPDDQLIERAAKSSLARQLFERGMKSFEEMANKGAQEVQVP